MKSVFLEMCFQKELYETVKTFIQQGRIDQTDTKNVCFKSLLIFWTWYSSEIPEKTASLFPQKYEIVFNIDDYW